jgi:hypothetical protein
MKELSGTLARLAVALVVVCGGIYFFQHLPGCSQPETVTIPRDTVTITVERIDTLIIERTVYKRLPARIDTVYLENNQRLVTASADTITSEGDTVAVQYFFPPENYFSISLNYAPREIKVRDKYITITNDVIHHRPNVWQKLLYGSLGAAVGYSASQLLK